MQYTYNADTGQITLSRPLFKCLQAGDHVIDSYYADEDVPMLALTFRVFNSEEL